MSLSGRLRIFSSIGLLLVGSKIAWPLLWLIIWTALEALEQTRMKFIYLSIISLSNSTRKQRSAKLGSSPLSLSTTWNSSFPGWENSGAMNILKMMKKSQNGTRSSRTTHLGNKLVELKLKLSLQWDPSSIASFVLTRRFHMSLILVSNRLTLLASVPGLTSGSRNLGQNATRDAMTSQSLLLWSKMLLSLSKHLKSKVEKTRQLEMKSRKRDWPKRRKKKKRNEIDLSKKWLTKTSQGNNKFHLIYT